MKSKQFRSDPAVLLDLKPIHGYDFSAIGTNWWLGIYETIPADVLTKLQIDLTACSEEFDKIYSRFRADSWISMVANKAGSYVLPSDAAPLFDFYRQLYNVSNGQVTPLIGQTLSDAGYDANYSLRPKPLQPVVDWDDVMQLNDTTLITSQPLLLDFGAAGKGYLVDILSEIIEGFDITQYCLDGSGDLRFRHNTQTLRVGLEHPLDPSLAVGVAHIYNQSLCGSAGNRRAWNGYHHIIDPDTLASTDEVLATWAIADNTMLADGLATALFFMSADTLAKHFTFSSVRMLADMSLQVSKNFEGEVFNG